MADTVYSATTTPNPKASCFSVPSEKLDRTRFIIKILEVLLSFVAFVVEEVVNVCLSCTSLYFFEFISCTAFLFTLLLLVLLATTLSDRVAITCWPKLDFIYTAAIALLFFIASIVFVSNAGTSLENTAVAFGFLASVAFVVDLIFFVTTNGLPFSRGGKAEASNGVAAATAPPQQPEEEKLTAPTN